MKIFKTVQEAFAWAFDEKEDIESSDIHDYLIGRLGENEAK